MASLEICLLGTYQVTRDSALITAFDSNKVRGLLAYLAVESERAHARDVLAALLWPDSAQEAALSSLRNALSNLRRAIGDRDAVPPNLLITRETVQFDRSSDYRLDAADLLRQASVYPPPYLLSTPNEIERCTSAVDGYRGPFLAGFSLPDCAVFEEWIILWRERLGRIALEMLSRLADHYESCGDYARSLEFAQRMVALDAWLEESQRQVMRVLALSGRRSAALAQYEICKRALADELGVEPADETRRLYAAIRAGELANLHPGRVLPAPGAPPYRGLCHFDQADADLFFGREILTTRLVERVEEMAQGADGGQPLLAVVGASGSGKSSLVRAGVAPALRNAGWEVQVITPTAHPLTTLEMAFPDNRRSRREVLIIDQFEELFSLCREESERETFLENIFNLARPVILVLRADFYGHCAAYPRLRVAVSARQEFIGAMDAGGLRRAIEEPARCMGWELEPGLVDLLLDEVGASCDRAPEPGALPLLEHALLETWERRRGMVLTLAGYVESGGVRGAIAQTAERVYGGLSADEQPLARKIFLRLTELGEGTKDTRRRAALSELRAIGEADGQVDALLEALAAARLVILAEETAEVTHEALIREWPALQRWLYEDREGLRLHRHLTEGAANWDQLERDEGELYRGARLAQALDWAGQNEHARELTSMEVAFLSASHQREDREVREREEQRRRELETALKLAETESKRAEEREQAAQQIQREERLAYAGELAAQSKTRLTDQPDLSLLLALEAVAVLERAGLPMPWDVQQAVHDVALSSRLLWSCEKACVNNGIIFAPDGQRVYHQATFDSNYEKGFFFNEKIFALDAESGEELFAIQSDGCGVAITPDGKILATANGARACLWDAVTGEKLLTIPLPHPDDLYHASMNLVSPDGRYLHVNVDADNGCLVDLEPWHQAGSPAGLTLQLPLKHFDRCSWNCPGNAFSPDGKTFTTAWEKDSTYILWDTETVTPLRIFSGHTNLPRSNSFSPDGSRMASCSYDRSVRIWDVSSARELRFLAGHTHAVHSVTYSPDGRKLASASNDGLVILWDAENGQRLLDLHAGGPAFATAFSPDGGRLCNTTFTGIVNMWDVSSCGRGELAAAPVFAPRLIRMGSPDGSLVVDVNPDGSVALLDTATLHEATCVVVSPAPGNTILPSLDRDNTRLAVDVGGRISVWDIHTGKKLFDLPAEDGWDAQFAFVPTFSPDGTLLAVGGYSGKITLWNLVSRQKERVLSIRAGSPPCSCQFSPDGKRLAMGCCRTTDSGGGEVWIWDLAEPNKPARILIADLFFFANLCFSPDGHRLASCGGDPVARIWDVDSGETILFLRGHSGTIYSIRYSPNGRYLVTASGDGSVRVWDAENGSELLSYHLPGQYLFTMAFFTPDSRRVVACGNDDHYRLLAFQDFDELLEIVRGRVTRDWKPEERRRYLRQQA